MDAQQSGGSEVDQAYDVFISYAHDDADHDVANARVIAEWLESLGYRVWWDRHLLTGELWLEALVQQATKARRVLMLWSPRSSSRSWVWTEARIGAGHRKLVPLVIEKHPVPEEFSHVQFTDITDFEAQKPEILKALGIEPSGKHLRSPAPENARISLTGLPSSANIFIGRDIELSRLVRAWDSTAPGADPAQKTNVFVLHAVGGAGKSALMRRFLDGLADRDFDGAAKIYAWSAYSQGSGDNRATSADEFIAKALAFFGYDLARHPISSDADRGRKLAAVAGASRALLILDGLEPLQDAPHVNLGRLKDRGLKALIEALALNNKGFLLITSRQELPELGVSNGGGPSPGALRYPFPLGEGEIGAISSPLPWGEGLGRTPSIPGPPAQPPTNEARIISLELNRMDVPSGVELLKAHGAHGKRSELERAVNEVLGHALSLNLLGTYLAAVHAGDINQREQFHLGDIEDAPTDLIGDATARFAKRAARIIEGTIARFETLERRTAEGGEAEMAILHMVGLFDRPAEREALEALLAEPAIPGLTDAFHGLRAQQRKARWNVAVERLRKLRLLAGGDGYQPSALDAHPIVRAHFGDRLKSRALEAYREAHSRLYDYYRYLGLPQPYRTPETYNLLLLGARASYNRDSEPLIDVQPDHAFKGTCFSRISARAKYRKLVDTMQPSDVTAFNEALSVFQPTDLQGMNSCLFAIAHGCAAGLYEEVFSEVYAPRVQRGFELYIVQKLGAPNTALAALAPFFLERWSTTTTHIAEIEKAEVLSDAAFALWSLGRLHEAIEPFKLSLKVYVNASLWKGAAIMARNASELHLTLGDIAEATSAARLSVTYVDASGEDTERLEIRTTLADVLHQAGIVQEASMLFAEAERIQALRQPEQPLLVALYGYRYCDLLLAQDKPQIVLERSKNALNASRTSNATLLTKGVSELSLGRCLALLATSSLPDTKTGDIRHAQSHMDDAVHGLRCAAQDDYLPRGLLDRAAFRRSIGDFTGAAADLGEAYQIAYYGGMRLHLTDCHLETARLLLAQLAAAAPQPASRAGFWGRLFGRAPAHAAAVPRIEPAESEAMRAAAEAHAQAAAVLIEATGYKRRLGELAALRACLQGGLPAHMLAPNRDEQGRPIWHGLATG
jgi:hypothetical protein